MDDNGSWWIKIVVFLVFLLGFFVLGYWLCSVKRREKSKSSGAIGLSDHRNHSISSLHDCVDEVRFDQCSKCIGFLHKFEKVGVVC